MVTQVSEQYQDYKKRKNHFENIKSNVFLYSLLVGCAVMYLMLSALHPTMAVHEIGFGALLFSGLIASGISELCLDRFIKKYEDLDDFAFAQLKNKYKNCLWLDSSIHFEHNGKTYKVIKIKEKEDFLQIVSKETQSFIVDEID